MNELNIAITFERNYLTPVFVMLTSVFINNRMNFIHFHVIASSLTPDEKVELVEFISQNNSTIVFYDIDFEEVKSKVIIPADSHFIAANYYRLYFPELVDVDRLLYIDVDTVVIGDLKQLYEHDLKGFPFGAVIDPHPVIREDLGIYETGKYLNTGVILFDIKRWKEQDVTNKCFEYAKTYPEKMSYVEQDALNATMIDNWLPLDKKYNVMLLDVVLQVPQNELIKDKVIIHYTSPSKPWLCLSKNKLRGLYHHYLKLSPRRQEQKYTDLKWEAKTAKEFVRLRVKEIYFDYRLYKIFPIKKWIEGRSFNY